MAKILWRPNQINDTHMMKFMDRVNNVYDLDINSYQDLHDWSIKNIPEFLERDLESIRNNSFKYIYRCN